MGGAWLNAAVLSACCITTAVAAWSTRDREMYRPMLTSEWLGKKEHARREVQDMFHRHRFSSAFQRGSVMRSSMLSDAADEVDLIPPPFTVVPPFSLATSGGDVEVTGGEDSSYIFALHHADNFTEALWFKSDLQKAFSSLPPKAHLVFAASTEDGAAAVSELEALCQDAEGFDEVKDRVHFVSDPLPVDCGADEFPHCPLNEDLEDGLGTMLQAFASWGSYESKCSASWGEAGETQKKVIDCIEAEDWLPSVKDVEGGDDITGELALWGGDACGSEEPKMDVSGKIAVINRGTCSFFHKVAAAAEKGARAVLVASQDDLSMMGCSEPDDCKAAKLQIPAVMVSAHGLKHLESAVLNGVAVTMSLESVLRSERLVGLDHRGRLREVGQLRTHDGLGMEMAVKEAAGYAYEAALQDQISEGDGKLVLAVMEGEDQSGGEDAPMFSGSNPLRAKVEFPEEDRMWDFDTMQVYLQLGCPTQMDKSCGAWDYPVSLKLCSPSSPAHPEPACSLEAGRWITPYGRRGEWLTDATALLPFVRHGGAREFVLEQPAWSAQHYRATVKLVLADSGEDDTPLHTTVLFEGGRFDAQYNARHKPIEVQIAAHASRIELSAMVSGHGWGTDSEDCAEFCVSEHRFVARRALRVDGELFVAKEIGTRNYELEGAGSGLGCADKVQFGVTPNQYGTWEYGRAGWCPGGAVEVWTGDVSNHLKPGMQGVVTYQGLVDGKPFNPKPCEGDECASQGFPAEIRMQSLLVAYGRRPADGDSDEGWQDLEPVVEGDTAEPLHPNGRPGGSAHTMKGAQTPRSKPIVALQVEATDRKIRGVSNASEAVWVGVLAAAVLMVAVGTVANRSRLRGYWQLRG